MHILYKFYQNAFICSEDIEEKHILYQSRAITLLFMNKFSTFAIPNHSSPISMSMQRLKKIGQKLLKLEAGNEPLTDGRTLKRFGGYNIPLFVAGYKKQTKYYAICNTVLKSLGSIRSPVIWNQSTVWIRREWSFTHWIRHCVETGCLRRLALLVWTESFQKIILQFGLFHIIN